MLATWDICSESSLSRSLDPTACKGARDEHTIDIYCNDLRSRKPDRIGKGEAEFVSCILIQMRRLISSCFHLLQRLILKWTKPFHTSLLLGTVMDLTRGKPELVAENALLRQQLIILRRQIKRPRYTRTDRLLLILLARTVRIWRQALVIVQPETLLRWHRQGCAPLLEAEGKAKVDASEGDGRDHCVDQGDGKAQSPSSERSASAGSSSSWIFGEVKRTIQKYMKQSRATSSPWTELEDFLAQSCCRGVGLRFPPDP